LEILRGAPILVVEDDAPSAKLASLLLTQQGANVRIAPNAEEALRVLTEFLPRLVVLDLVLPRMGGLLLAQHIKADPQLRDVVVVAATVISGLEVERLALAAGCAGYLRKPIDTETFAASLAACLEENR
jgi:two-component system cell cycle response regulator DivK